MVTVMVIPGTDPIRPRWPSPDRLFLGRVCRHLESRRLVTTEIHVRGPEYVAVRLSIGLSIRAGFFRDSVIQAVKDRLEEYLSALPPGGPEEKGWPLGKALVKKDLESVAIRVRGVELVESSHLAVGDLSEVEEYSLGGLSLPFLELFQVKEGEADSLADLMGRKPDPAARPLVVPIPVAEGAS